MVVALRWWTRMLMRRSGNEEEQGFACSRTVVVATLACTKRRMAVQWHGREEGSDTVGEDRRQTAEAMDKAGSVGVVARLRWDVTRGVSRRGVDVLAGRSGGVVVTVGGLTCAEGDVKEGDIVGAVVDTKARAEVLRCSSVEMGVTTDARERCGGWSSDEVLEGRSVGRRGGGRGRRMVL